MMTPRSVLTESKGLWTRPRSATRRGMAMVGTMLILFLLMGITLLGVIVGTHGGNGLTTTTGNAIASSRRQAFSVASFNVAESGVDYAIQWLSNQQYPPGLTPDKSFPLPGWNGNPGDAGHPYSVSSGNQSGSFTVTIYPASINAASRINGGPIEYIIESTGTCQGVSQIIRAWVKVASFGQYAFFTDNDPAGIYWVAGRNSFDGPVHCNGNGGSSNVLWQDNTPIFHYMDTNAFTYSNGVNWYYNSSSNAQAPGASDYTSVANVGQSGIHQTPDIAMPTFSYQQQYAALGKTFTLGVTNSAPTGAPGSSTPTGVTAPAGGGVYIHDKSSSNNVNQVTLSVDGNGNQVVDITQVADDGKTLGTRVTMLPTSTTVRSGEFTTTTPNLSTFAGSTPANGMTTTTAGQNNGVVYSDDDIGTQGASPSGGLTGTIADNNGLTIATDSNHNVNLDGNVVYNTPRQKDAGNNFLPESDSSNASFMANAGQFGLVTNTLTIVDNGPTGAALGDVELDGTVLAFNTLTADDYITRSPHNFYCMGGEIASHRGSLGQFNSGTLQQISGLAGHYAFDGRLAYNPPPFFPTTTNSYTVLSWQRVQSTLQ